MQPLTRLLPAGSLLQGRGGGCWFSTHIPAHSALTSGLHTDENGRPYGSVGLCLGGCLGVWVCLYESVGLWVCESTIVHIRGSVGTELG